MSVNIKTENGLQRYDSGTSVIANPTLSGTEDSLESLQVGNVIYKGISDEEKTSWNGKVDKTLVSDAWDNTKSYVVGDYCIYNDSLWKCLANNSNITPTEGTYWTSVSIAEQFGGLRFGFDGNGNYGYYKVGADTLTPFKRVGVNTYTLSSYGGKVGDQYGYAMLSITVEHPQKISYRLSALTTALGSNAATITITGVANGVSETIVNVSKNAVMSTPITVNLTKEYTTLTLSVMDQRGYSVCVFEVE